MTIGPLPVITNFDSGLVPVDPQFPFPRIDITTTAEPECRRDSIRMSTGLSPCYPDCDGTGGLTGSDMMCFLMAFASGWSYADCDGVGCLTANDLVCFVTAYHSGCL